MNPPLIKTYFIQDYGSSNINELQGLLMAISTYTDTRNTRIVVYTDSITSCHANNRRKVHSSSVVRRDLLRSLIEYEYYTSNRVQAIWLPGVILQLADNASRSGEELPVRFSCSEPVFVGWPIPTEPFWVHDGFKLYVKSYIPHAVNLSQSTVLSA